jgi:hypothetical protein
MQARFGLAEHVDADDDSSFLCENLSPGLFTCADGRDARVQLHGIELGELSRRPPEIVFVGASVGGANRLPFGGLGGSIRARSNGIGSRGLNGPFTDMRALLSVLGPRNARKNSHPPDVGQIRRRGFGSIHPGDDRRRVRVGVALFDKALIAAIISRHVPFEERHSLIAVDGEHNARSI